MLTHKTGCSDNVSLGVIFLFIKTSPLACFDCCWIATLMWLFDDMPEAHYLLPSR